MIKPNQQLAFVASLTLLVSCASNEIGQSKDVNQETIYQQYLVEYDASENECKMTAQFRFAGEDGTTLELNNPSKFECDGIAAKVDSGGFAGAYYRINIPAKKHLGTHQLSFTDFNKKVYQNEFVMDSFYLANVPAVVDRAAPALVYFKAPVLKGDDYIELASEGTDSSFSVTYHTNDKNGYITIPAKELQRQKKNEFSVVATLYRKIPLQQLTKEGGSINTIQTTKPTKITISNPAQ